LNQWRVIAGNNEKFPLTFRSKTWLYDMRLEKDGKRTLPELPIENASVLLYVFNGEIKTNSATLNTGESLFVEYETLTITALTSTDLVLFVTDKNSDYSENGMYSGNQIRK
jgi:quercetin 2,3-dioxygenase